MSRARNVDYGKGETTNWRASADTFVPKSEPGKEYIVDEDEGSIPF